MNGNETKGYFYLPLPELFSPRVGVGLEIVEASHGRDFCVRDVVAVKFNIYDDNDSEIVESRGHNSNQQETTDREDKEFQSLSFKRSVFFSSARRSKQLAY